MPQIAPVNPTLPGDADELSQLADATYALAVDLVEAARQWSAATGPVRNLAVNADEHHTSVCTNVPVADQARTCAQQLRELADRADTIAGELDASAALRRHSI